MAWTVRHALYLLLGRADSITLEPGGALGEGAEFALRRNGRTEVCQVKRQNGNAGTWTVASLRDKGIWNHLRAHVEAGDDFHFVSLVPARPIQELADRARRSDDYDAFAREWLTDELQGHLDALAAPDIYGSRRTAWQMLRGLWVGCHDEADVVHVNAALAELVLAGASGPLAALALADLLMNNLGTTLDAQTITRGLAAHGLRRRLLTDDSAVAEAVGEVTRRWAAAVERELLRPAIERVEAGQLVERITGAPGESTLVTGTAGGGKSAVLHQGYRALDAQGTPVLAFRLDRLDRFSSTHELGRKIGLPVSPVSALGAVADGRPCVLIVDQLDAISLASGRMPDTFDTVADMVREAAAFPDMHVVMACREFDVHADHRIRLLIDRDHCAQLTVASLTDDQIDAALAGMGLNPDRLGPDLARRALFRSPLHLALLTHVEDRAEALSFRTPLQLFDAFWDAKQRSCRARQPAVKFAETLTVIAEAMSARQRLSVPHTVFDEGDLAVSGDVLVSEHVCVRDGRQLAFFHESFFDYAFARSWIRQGETLTGFLSGGEQELFRRGQVRQVLHHLRELEPERFVEEVEELLTTPEVRYHLKETVLSLLRDLENPTALEWDAVSRVLDTRPPFGDHLAAAVSTGPWFVRADERGAVADWLDGDDQQEHAWSLRLMQGAAKKLPDRLAEILAPHTSHDAYRNWLGGVVISARLSDSRPLFDLLLEAVRDGRFAFREHGLWYTVGDLGQTRPEWAVELLALLLSRDSGALDLDGDGRVAGLLGRDQMALRMVTAAASGAPETFCEQLLPVLLDVMAVAAYPERPGWPVMDRHFAFRYPDEGPRTLDGALFQGAATALRVIAGRDPERVRPFVDTLAATHYDAAQWLLYQALIAAGPALASRAGEIVLQNRKRLLCGYASSVVWGTREVLQAVGDTLPGDMFRRLEEALSYLRLPPDDEFAPWQEFTLLTALPERRLSARAVRRLEELRRRFGGVQQPDEPEGITSGFIGPPVPLESARRMSDAQWLGAMRKHNEERTNMRAFTGGAHEQANVLQDMTAADPGRFARLALSIDAATNPEYGAALLRGLGEAEPLSDPSDVFEAVRHLARLGKPEHDRWLGQALGKYLDSVPADLVEALLDRALSSTGTDTVAAHEPDLGDPDPYFVGINSVRGSAAESLGNLLIHDQDGSRAALVVPHLDRLAADPSPAFRSCVAHLLHAALRHDRDAVAAAFTALITGFDRILSTRHVVRLAIALAHGDPAIGRFVAHRMLRSAEDDVRRVGGSIAALAAMQWEMPDLLETVLAGNDGPQRRGAAEVCAARLANAGDTALAHRALTCFFHDHEEDVCSTAAAVAAALRGRRLNRFRSTLTELIGSPAFRPALPQLLITLENAPDRVDDLLLMCVRRFIDEYGPASTDLATHAAADAHHVGGLLVRAYAQAVRAGRRSEILDLLDELLLLGSYGVAEAVAGVDRR
ncbi:hypothetical protein [Streptomyces sp. NPDC052225]|uniref:hypothetical protein n=1 Tax=Streptomyces sp. NPDC052225 TaxID=3154949 RepID=UPI0034488521